MSKQRKELALVAEWPEVPATEAEWEDLYRNRAFLKALREIKVHLLRHQSAAPRNEEEIIANAYVAAGLRLALKAIQFAETGTDQFRKADNGD